MLKLALKPLPVTQTALKLKNHSLKVYRRLPKRTGSLALGVIFLFLVLGFSFRFASGLRTTGTNLNLNLSLSNPGRLAILSLNLPRTIADLTPPTKLKLNQAQEIQIRLDTGGASIQKLSAKLSYPPQLLNVKSIDFTNTVCSFISKQDWDRAAGVITVECQTPSGLMTQLNPFFSLIVTPLETGSAFLRFQSNATKAIAALDGTTDVLYRSENRAFPILKNDETLPSYTSFADSTLVRMYGDLVHPSIPVTSATHPLITPCSPGSLAELNWLQPIGIHHFLYAFDQNLVNLNPTQETVSRNLSLPVSKGTTSYFHLRGVTSTGEKGPITTYPVTSCKGGG
jgi:hypothetical protein